MRTSIGTLARPTGTERIGRLESRWFVVDGWGLHARVSVEPVPAAAPAVVLVHGLGVASTYLVPTAVRLALDYPVYAPDIPGFGESAGRQRFALTDAAGHLAALLDRLGIGPAGVVGHSMGGYVAVELAADFHDRVSRLVLVDAALLPAGFLSPRQLVNLTRAARRAPLRLLPTMVADAHRAGPPTVWRATRELLAADPWPKLGRIQTPTLVVWGERDLVVPPAIGRRLARDLRHGELAIIPRAGHVPMWERPEEFNRLVLDFLRR